MRKHTVNPDPRAFRTSGVGAAGTVPRGPRRWPALILLFCFVALMWVVEAGDWLLRSAVGPPGLDDDGVRPLSSDGLPGILFQPFLHGDWAHLIGNSVALLVLGSIIALSGLSPLIRVTLVSWVLSGAVSWLLGGVGTVHIGASGIVFGYIFYVIVRGLFSRRFLHLAIGLIIGFYYGLEALAGLSPMLDGVSWQGHLGGAVGGVLSAYGLRRNRGKTTAVNAGQPRRGAGFPR
ncbi:rhomboid family intramembrane serine protease [Rhodococcus sp. IEGM 1408]|uniref:rhomboid family intramembrane serine protease n=1 Tax=Rhodococcus sp. IEGM 1408 TaxID=3082220 RepID=UPI0029534EBF|nr:rhomboid family intramembrane serine protease [Rhodococcus sp. IEGM 1408]MDV8000807.1 rhomboid family intramembrane serine protease [Rhodococcus sp. IEGM 1408]